MGGDDDSASNAASGVHASGERGFTLIEVLVALGIMMIGVSVAFALFAAATAAHKRAINRTNSAAIAEQAMADLESALRAGATPEELAASQPFEALRRDYPGYEIEARFYTGPDDVAVVEIIVRWTSQGQKRDETYRQLVTRTARIR